MSLVAAAIIGGVASGVLNGAMAMNSAGKNAKAHRPYAKEIKNAAEKYSGMNAYNAMQNAGNEEGNLMNRRALQAQTVNNDGSAMMAKQGNLTGGFGEGYNLGSSNKQKELTSRYNYDTAGAQAALNQAGIDYKANTAVQQAAMNTAGGLADLYKNTTSDENQKTGINNESGLPKSDIEDSLSQLETIQYKYKDSSVPGCDDEEHKSGFTAQSLEKTPMGKDIVKEGDDGVKRIDNWKLQEALTAGMAQLQREIDELEKKSTSDELCKETYRTVTKQKNKNKAERR